MHHEIQNTSIVVDAMIVDSPVELAAIIAPTSRVRVRVVSPRSRLLNAMLLKIVRGQIALDSSGAERKRSFASRALEALQRMDATEADRQEVAKFLVDHFSGEALLNALVGNQSGPDASWEEAFTYLLRNSRIYLELLSASCALGAMIRLSDADRLRLRARLVSSVAFRFISQKPRKSVGSRYHAALYALCPRWREQARARTWFLSHPNKRRPLDWWAAKHPGLIEHAAGMSLIGKNDMLRRFSL